MEITDERFKNRNLTNPGHISAKLVEHLAQRFPPELIAQKIDDLLKAQHMTKGGNLIDDNRAREAAIKMLLSYIVGLPVQRVENVNYDVPEHEALEKLISTPAGIEMMERMLNQAKENLAQRKAIEAESVPAGAS